VPSVEWQQTLRERADHMRKCPTRAEATLYERLGRRPGGLFFWTQHVIGNRYIADFYCPAARLVIEVDGDSHDSRAVQDRQRDDVMYEFGFRVMRLSNVSVLADPDAAVARILEAADDPHLLDAQRRHEEGRRRAERLLAEQQNRIRQRPLVQSIKARFRCTWCLADFVTAVAPSPRCRRCLDSELVPVCVRCAFRKCSEPRGMCRTCMEASLIARGAVGTPMEHVNRNGRHRVRKVF
jgi:very-short-patch-repair endonuclease